MSEIIESGKLPIWRTIRETCLLPFQHMRIFLLSYSIGMLALAAFLGALVLLVAVYKGSYQAEGLLGSPAWIIGLMLMLPLGLIAFLVGIFNLWVRVAVIQNESAWRQSVGHWVRQIASNAFNLFWIGIVVAVISWIILAVVLAALTMLIGPMIVGLGSGDPELFFGSIFLMGLVVGVATMPAVVLVCYVYARFSLHLVKGALGGNLQTEPAADVMKKDALRFALILAAVYAVGYVAKALSSVAIEVPVLGLIAGFLGLSASFYAIAVIGAAHGLVFRRKAEQQVVIASGGDRESDIPTLDVFASPVVPEDQRSLETDSSSD